MNDYQYSPEGLALTKESEQLRLVAYPDPGTGGDPWTNGYGHTGNDVFEGLVITEQQADKWLIHDTEKAASEVKRLVTVALTQHQFDALVDFTFNVGSGNLAKSTLLKLINAKQFAEADQHFQDWVYGGGHKLSGLIKRRYAESVIFMRNN